MARPGLPASHRPRLRLETDESLPIADRVAGCLVLQYGQSTDRIVNLTVAQVRIHPDEPGVLGPSSAANRSG
ncbi:hypothetical protein [Kitasatospora sp. NPDC059160]|uniref:hypothetical protein n=1 Tax=Kitasatospora sp. NPDC059160 TaxID=3346748 RepID=UPI0036BA73EA